MFDNRSLVPSQSECVCRVSTRQVPPLELLPLKPHLIGQKTFEREMTTRIGTGDTKIANVDARGKYGAN